LHLKASPTGALFLQGVHPDDRERQQAAQAAALRGEEPYDCIYRVCRPDGSERRVRSISEVQRDAQGRAVRMVGTVQDITEAQAARDALVEKQRLVSVLQETTQLGLWFFDDAGITVELNPAMCGILGRPRDQVLGQPMDAFVAAGQAPAAQPGVAAGGVPTPRVLDLQLARPDGTLVHCLVNLTPLTLAAGMRLARWAWCPT
jgi:PAS domain S-box-containing protein